MLGHFGMIPLINHDSSEGEQGPVAEFANIQNLHGRISRHLAHLPTCLKYNFWDADRGAHLHMICSVQGRSFQTLAGWMY